MVNVNQWGTIAREVLGPILTHAKKEFGQVTKDGEHVIHVGAGSGELVNDTEIAADKALGAFFQNAFGELDWTRRIVVEGAESVVVHPEGTLDVFVDPLDGSLDFEKRRGGMGLPFCGVVTILEAKDGQTFKEIVAAGVVDYRSGDLWIAWQTAPGQYETQFNGNVPMPEQAQRINLGRMIVLAELYYPDNRELACEMFRGEKGWFRNPGSAAYEMACVANGTVAAMFCGTQKQHELGAAYAIVKGAGGTVCDFEGRPLDDIPFTFNVQTPAICAGNASIAAEIVERAARGAAAIKNRALERATLEHLYGPGGLLHGRGDR